MALSAQKFVETEGGWSFRQPSRLAVRTGDYCGAYPKDGFCNTTATVCTDGRYRCYCKLSYP